MLCEVHQVVLWRGGVRTEIVRRLCRIVEAGKAFIIVSAITIMVSVIFYCSRGNVLEGGF